jgi:membrane protease YdiL (CAAX protease family)
VILGLLRSFSGFNKPPPIWFAPKAFPAITPQAIGYSIFAAALMIALGYYLYRLYLRLVEKREPAELRRNGWIRDLCAGTAVGIGIVGLIIGCLWALGMFAITEINSPLWLLPAIAVAATAAFMEELVLRGILFRIIEEYTGTWLALAATAALFGFAHLGNAHATLWGALALAMSGGIVLGGAYVATRSLWLPIGIHFGVNLAEGGIFGLVVSGTPSAGVLRSTTAGPLMMTGGTFGIEASVFTAIIGAVLGALLLTRAYRRGQIVRPFWKRGKSNSSALSETGERLARGNE